jgi:hypothetical protein
MSFWEGRKDLRVRGSLLGSRKEVPDHPHGSGYKWQSFLLLDHFNQLDWFASSILTMRPFALLIFPLIGKIAESANVLGRQLPGFCTHTEGEACTSATDFSCCIDHSNVAQCLSSNNTWQITVCTGDNCECSTDPAGGGGCVFDQAW